MLHRKEDRCPETLRPQKDPNGTWWFVVDVISGKDGRRQQAKRRGFRTKAEAQAVMDELRVAARQGTFVTPAAPDGEAVPRRGLAASSPPSARREHLGELRAQRSAPHRACDRQGPAASPRWWRSQPLVHRAVGEWPHPRQAMPGLKPRTVRYIHTIIHSALDDAVQWRRVQLNAANQAAPPVGQVGQGAGDEDVDRSRAGHVPRTHRRATDTGTPGRSWPRPDAAGARPSVCGGPTSTSTRRRPRSDSR